MSISFSRKTFPNSELKSSLLSWRKFNVIVIHLYKNCYSIYNMPPPEFLDTTNSTSSASSDNEHEQQSPLDVLVNILLLIFTLMVLSLIYYVICFIMLKLHPALESTAAASSRARRAAFIKENLLVHEWDNGDQEDDNSTTTESKRELPIQLGTDDDLAPRIGAKESELDNDDNSGCSTVSLDSEFDGCAICLAEYIRHQRVCESSNPACTHMFHEECMVSWLMKHHGCPICRQKYITLSA